MKRSKRGFQKGASVLDVGCGNGRLSEWLEGDVDYLGVDHSEALIRIAQKNHPQRTFQMAEMSQLDLKLPFDVIFTIAALHHVPERAHRRETIQRLHNHLKPKGVVIMTVWNLCQRKYSTAWWKALWNWVRHAGKKGGWNDLWIPWKTEDQLRYYHAFTHHELKQLFHTDLWTIERLYESAFNINVILRKK
ncbi:class I SAM-dependent methyltransferase [Candidatus Peregrinibacteria bacterium]|nr:MAG: class I SAM-dependent methyltransferase [Candidatus Peregrinibacteria bacterium]